MALKDILSSTFGKSPESDIRYEVEATEFGLRFHSVHHAACKSGDGPGLLQWQFIFLRGLCEAGEAEEWKDGFFLEGDTATKLSPEDREILNLPPAWPGRFELDIKGHTFTQGGKSSLSRLTPSFSIALILIRPNQRKVKHYRFEGPYLILGEGEFYLPDETQILAFRAVGHHSALPPEKKTEGANLLAVHALQQAQTAGLPIELRHFEEQKIEQPERIKVTTIENPDGSLRLIPDFWNPLTPEQIERCLGQLESDGAISLRVADRIVLFDEQRLKAVKEILSNRGIPAKERDQFLQTPGAFLDASLLDLDNGLSIRVHGAEVFQKAYFGETDGQSQSWFGDSETEPDVITLSAVSNFLNDRSELINLKSIVEKAVRSGATSVLHKGKTILLPNSPDEIKTILEELDRTVSDKDDDDNPNKDSRKQNGHRETTESNITLKLELNDDQLAQGLLTLSPQGLPIYTGAICADGCRLTPFPYQEYGIRWILGLAGAALQLPEKNRFGGALLADDMGLGKTFMALSALQVFLHMMAKHGKPKPILVVAPVALLENWQDEVKKVFESNPFGSIVILQSDQDLSRFKQVGAGRETKFTLEADTPPESAIRYSLKVGKDFGNARLDMPDRLVLTNYDTLRDYQFSLCTVDWGMVIFDEAQDIKNPNAMKARAAKGLKADFRLAVTGTPVENNLKDFWSIFDTVSPGLLGAYKDFQQTYITPIKKAEPNTEPKVRQEVGERLRRDVGELMLRRTKEDQLDSLPQKIIHNGGDESSKYGTVMSDLQLQRYNAVVASVASARASGDSQKVQQAILPGLKSLQNVSLHPALLDGGAPSIPSDAASARAAMYESGKLRILLDILEEIQARNEKVIIFAVNKKLQLFLSIALGRIYGLSIEIVNGDTKSVTSRSGRGKESRKQILVRFQETSGFGVVIMSPLAAGVGLTVVGANNVIHLERHWNPAKEAQATDRVYRIGQQRDVHVYIPILEHPTLKSFDKNLQELLGRKVDLKDAVVTPREFAPDDFDGESIFGVTPTGSERVTADWLPNISWKNLEALAAELAAKELKGSALLTPNNDFGADVVFFSENINALIQCKSTNSSLEDAKFVLEPYNAKPEYERRLNKKFSTLILCTNSEKVCRRVLQKAQTVGVKIWSRKELSNLLEKHIITYEHIKRRIVADRVAL